ncbi:eukaryotic translation initiation factor 3 subunit G-like [Amphiura filiformis]|uniref:eukaryotic translation initiation factor 3 subunit G-like n=1 Tax=Amphiura filiformis TaxID=82378 RepID=UPI003B224956
MPTGESTQPISWADQVEAGDLRTSIPPPEEIIDGDIKKLIEYRREEDGKLVKITRTFKVERLKASKTVAHRKAWGKFGKASQDGSGPNPSTTIISDDVYMQFITAKDGDGNQQEEDTLTKLKQQRIVMCRVCKGDHWTTKCPYKDSLEPLQKELLQGGTGTGGAGSDTETDGGAAKPDAAKSAGGPGKYVPPGARAGAKGRGETMASRRDEGATIRVTNLSEDTREYDLQELFRPFGAIQRIYLAMDKNTGQSKGFAFINFYNRESAARAIAGVSGFGYDHLILKVEWAKPSGQH